MVAGVHGVAAERAAAWKERGLPAAVAASTASARGVIALAVRRGGERRSGEALAWSPALAEARRPAAAAAAVNNEIKD